MVVKGGVRGMWRSEVSIEHLYFFLPPIHSMPFVELRVLLNLELAKQLNCLAQESKPLGWSVYFLALGFYAFQPFSMGAGYPAQVLEPSPQLSVEFLFALSG